MFLSFCLGLNLTATFDLFVRAPPFQRLAKNGNLSLHKQHNQKHRQPAEQRRNVPQMEPTLLIREPLLLAG